MKQPPELPEQHFWPAPDRRDEVWPRPMTRAQRQAARYRASKLRDRPIPKGWWRDEVEVTLTNGRTIRARLLYGAWGMLPVRPLTWVEHDQVHQAAYEADPWRSAYSGSYRGYILGGVSPWPDVLVCNSCGRAEDGRNPYVTGGRPEGYRSYLDELLERQRAHLAAQAAPRPLAEVVPFPGRSGSGEPA